MISAESGDRRKRTPP